MCQRVSSSSQSGGSQAPPTFRGGVPGSHNECLECTHVLERLAAGADSGSELAEGGERGRGVEGGEGADARGGGAPAVSAE